MKKSNIVIIALLAVLSAVLLWLWYFLGFNHVDDPLDLVVSIVWWVILVAAIVIITKVEKTRRERIRTVYVGDKAVFNSEAGLTDIAAAGAQAAIAGILGKLQYDFTAKDMPSKDEFDVKCLVRTSEFEQGEKEDSEPSKWVGEVAVPGQDQARAFSTPQELATILATV